MSTRITAGTVLVAAALLAGSATAAAPLQLGPSTHKQLVFYQGYYDGHKDGYVITDVSSKSQATAPCRCARRRPTASASPAAARDSRRRPRRC